jgi:hypothetical protein
MMTKSVNLAFFIKITNQKKIVIWKMSEKVVINFNWMLLRGNRPWTVNK